MARTGRTQGERERVENVILMLHALLLKYEQPQLGDMLNVSSGYQLIWRWRVRRSVPLPFLQYAIRKLYEDEFGTKNPEDVLHPDVVAKVRRGVPVQLEEILPPLAQ